MQYTLSAAVAELQDAGGAFGRDDLVKAVNKALGGLAGMKAWRCLRKVVRFHTVGPVFALPQGCAGLVRACVNGRPATVRGREFRFVHSGPGDTSVRRPPPGFAPANVVEVGTSPLMVEPDGAYVLFAYRDGPNPPTLAVKGTDHTGREARVVFNPEDYHDWPSEGGGDDPFEVEVPESPKLVSVDSVVLKGAATDGVTLYAAPVLGEPRAAVAQYHPKVPVPTFRRYEIQGVRRGQPVELLVEALIDPLPLVHDDDVVPFDGIEPIEWMVRADWAMKAGENAQAEKYRQAAAQWLQSREVRDETAQTQIVINSLVAGSPGEVSEEAYNI
ncbi:MAG: hypothetical protein HUJ63_13075 [Enterococcus sp.]|nr:hypothetical protein [Enterococcus sp.]